MAVAHRVGVRVGRSLDDETTTQELQELAGVMVGAGEGIPAMSVLMAFHAGLVDGLPRGGALTRSDAVAVYCRLACELAALARDAASGCGRVAEHRT